MNVLLTEWGAHFAGFSAVLQHVERFILALPVGNVSVAGLLVLMIGAVCIQLGIVGVPNLLDLRGQDASVDIGGYSTLLLRRILYHLLYLQHQGNELLEFHLIATSRN